MDNSQELFDLLKQERKPEWILPDTNVFCNDVKILNNYPHIVVISSVLRELDKHKSSHKQELAYASRVATRYIKDRMKSDPDSIKFELNDVNPEIILGTEYDKEYFDNHIVAVCKQGSYTLTTSDVLLQMKAKSLGVKVVEVDEEVLDDLAQYSGIKELFLDKFDDEDAETIKKIYTGDIDFLELFHNQYLIMWDKTQPHYNEKGEVDGYELIDVLRNNEGQLVKLKFKPTQDRFMGKTKPINVKQRLAFDMMQNKEVVGALLVGGAGSGKDHLIGAHMMKMLEDGTIDKIVVVRNIQPLKDSGQVGFLKGDLLSKMLTWVLPIADQLGGLDSLMLLIEQGKIEVQHFESIRGRSFNRVGVWVTEMQSMTDYHMKVLISRMGEESYLFCNGDVEQSDSDYNKYNSAINAFKKLRGNKMFAMVTLDKTERSNFAALHELL